MKKLLVILILLSFAGCGASTHQDWAFMESVGGLSVGHQDKNPSWLNIRGDISGLKEFSTKPTSLNSGLAVKSVEVRIEGTNIQIYVITTLVGKRYSSTEITGVNISGAKEGTYMVQYLNPDNSTVNLREVTIH